MTPSVGISNVCSKRGKDGRRLPRAEASENGRRCCVVNPSAQKSKGSMHVMIRCRFAFAAPLAYEVYPSLRCTALRCQTRNIGLAARSRLTTVDYGQSTKYCTSRCFFVRLKLCSLIGYDLFAFPFDCYSLVYFSVDIQNEPGGSIDGNTNDSH